VNAALREDASFDYNQCVACFWSSILAFGELTMVPFLLLFAPAFVVTMAAHAAGRGRGRGGRGGRNDAGLCGRSWNCNGEHAKEILRHWIDQTPGWLTVDEFAETKSDWILHHGNPRGFYLWVNLRRNYKATIDRYENHINPEIDFDGASFLYSFFHF